MRESEIVLSEEVEELPKREFSPSPEDKKRKPNNALQPEFFEQIKKKLEDQAMSLQQEVRTQQKQVDEL